MNGKLTPLPLAIRIEDGLPIECLVYIDEKWVTYDG